MKMSKYGVPFVDHEIDELKAECGVVDLMKYLRPHWPSENICTKIFTAGFMNRLVACQLDTDSDQSDVVLVRVFGQGTKPIIDRDKEILSIRILHAEGLAAPVYCRFKNGIAYGYTKGKCLTPELVLDERIHRILCQELVKFHRVDPNAVIKRLDSCEGATYDTKPYLFDRGRKFLDVIPDRYTDPEKDKRFREQIGSKSKLRAELESLEKELTSFDCPAVLCHNDLLHNNIVYNQETDKITLIDFEEVYVNFLPFELAAYFCEYANIHGDYNTSLIPEKDSQMKWLRVYLEEWHKVDGRDPEQITEKEVETLWVKVSKYILAYYLWASIWCLTQAEHSLKDVDFIDAATQMLGTYYQKKHQKLALKLP